MDANYFASAANQGWGTNYQNYLGSTASKEILFLPESISYTAVSTNPVSKVQSYSLGGTSPIRRRMNSWVNVSEVSESDPFGFRYHVKEPGLGSCCCFCSW